MYFLPACSLAARFCSNSMRSISYSLRTWARVSSSWMTSVRSFFWKDSSSLWKVKRKDCRHYCQVAVVNVTRTKDSKEKQDWNNGWQSSFNNERYHELINTIFFSSQPFCIYINVPPCAQSDEGGHSWQWAGGPVPHPAAFLHLETHCTAGRTGTADICTPESPSQPLQEYSASPSEKSGDDIEATGWKKKKTVF